MPTAIAMYVQGREVGVVTLDDRGTAVVPPSVERHIRQTFDERDDLAVPLAPSGEFVRPRDGERYLEALLMTYRSGIGTLCEEVSERTA